MLEVDGSSMELQADEIPPLIAALQAHPPTGSVEIVTVSAGPDDRASEETSRLLLCRWTTGGGGQEARCRHEVVVQRGKIVSEDHAGKVLARRGPAV